MPADEGARLDLAIITLERAWLNRPQHDGRKADAIRELGLTETAYYQRLNALLDDPAAWRLDFRVMDTVSRRRFLSMRQRQRPIAE